MNDYKNRVVESRKITNDEYNLIINLLDKYKMDKTNFMNNAKTLKLNKVVESRLIVNGYDPVENIIYYDEKSNLVCELLHVASSNNNICQGIIVKPNLVYNKPFGIGLNEGITDLFLEYATKKEGYFPFEKLCAKMFQYVYGKKIFDYYFKNDDGTFRYLFDEDITTFLTRLDECHRLIMAAKYQKKLDDELPLGLGNAVKICMDLTLEEMLNIFKNSKKDYKKNLNKLLKSKSMKPIYDVIGEYEFKM